MKPTHFSKTERAHTQAENRRGQPVSRPEPAARPSAGSARSGKRILLVDDDSTVRDSLQDVLVARGYVVIPAENGVQALHLASLMTLDLVLLDLNMPAKNGWETFERLTTGNPLLPVIIITARPNQVFTALSAGAAALLEKPMDISILLEAVARLLAETSEQRRARSAGKKTEFHYRPAIRGDSRVQAAAPAPLEPFASEQSPGPDCR
jgi:DNA-binding response OmpR family regulator